MILCTHGSITFLLCFAHVVLIYETSYLDLQGTNALVVISIHLSTLVFLRVNRHFFYYCIVEKIASLNSHKHINIPRLGFGKTGGRNHK